MPERGREVLGYFLRNPHAADTLDGVVRWRLREEKIHKTVEEVDHALGWLVCEGFLSKESPKGAESIFRLNQN